MHSSLRRSIGLSSVWTRQIQTVSLSTTSQTPQDGPSNIRTKIAAQHSLDEKIQIKQDHSKKEKKPHWQVQKEALRRNFPQGWNPPKKISRPSMALLRTLHKTDPQQFSLIVLSEKFKISPEAVRRILKSKWEPDQKSIDKKKKLSQTQQSPTMTTTKSIQQISSDGWVHHEKLETDQIPINLAQALQSPLHDSHLKAQPILKNHSQQNNFNMARVQTNKPSSPRFNDFKEYGLGSAFQQEVRLKKKIY